MTIPLISPTTVSLAELLAWHQKAQHLSLRALRINAQQFGSYLSRFKGRGMEFEEVRAYQPGDDVRYIDWRVTARTQKVQTKLFREEKERPILFCLDLRASMFFSSRQAYKSVLGAHIVALLAWAANHQKDRVGGIVFSEQACLTSMPQLRQKGVLNLLQTIVRSEAWHRTSAFQGDQEGGLRDCFLNLSKIARPGSLLFFISDWHNVSESTLNHIQQVARHQDVVMIFIYDPLEATLPPSGTYPIQVGEQAYFLDTHTPLKRAEYELQFKHRVQKLERLCLGMHAKFVRVATDANIFNLLNSTLNEQ